MPRPEPTRTFLAAIGDVAARSAALDETLRYLLCGLLDSRYGHVVGAGLSTGDLVESCRRVAIYNRRLSADAFEDCGTLLKPVGPLSQARNFLIHATWEKWSKPGEHYGIRSHRVKPTGGERRQSSVWTPADVTVVAHGYRDVRADLEVWMERTFDMGQFRGDLWSRPDEEMANAMWREFGWVVAPDSSL